MERTGQNQDVVPAQTAAPGGQDPAAESQRPLDKHHPVRRVSGRAPGAVRRWERGAWGCGQGLPLVGPEPPGPAFQSGLACLAHSAQRTGCPASPGRQSGAPVHSASLPAASGKATFRRRWSHRCSGAGCLLLCLGCPPPPVLLQRREEGAHTLT